MPGSTLNFITALLYGLAAVAAARAGVRSSNADVAGEGLVRGFCLSGLVCHAVVLIAELFGATGKSYGLNIGFSHAVSLIAWLAMGAYTLIGFDNRLLRIAALALAPLAAAAVLLPLAIPAQRIVQFGGVAFKAHVVAAMLAYALFTVASIHALLMLSLEKRLHEGELPFYLQGMPSLLRLERLQFQLLLVAFSLLTLTLASGALFSESLFGKPLQLNHKTVFALFSWAIFGGLLLGHWRFGWRGKLAIRWTLAGFILLFLSYVGSKFVLEILLKRA
jgi:ABC-type uncharacterized transport system permease subunit